MTEQTRKLISKFSITFDVSLVPSIILNMQEEDNVSNTIQFKNCFKQLRNLAAHEPHTITTQLLSKNNKGNTKIVLTSSKLGDVCKLIIDINQFTAWMFDMYVITDEVSYLRFWKTLCRIIYPFLNHKPESFNDYFEFNLDRHGNSANLYLAYANYLMEKKNVPKVFSVEDTYVADMYGTNRKLFWRITIPDFMSVTGLFISGDVDVYVRSNVETYLEIFREREGI